jgi:hypothetical protein
MNLICVSPILADVVDGGIVQTTITRQTMSGKPVRVNNIFSFVGT